LLLLQTFFVPVDAKISADGFTQLQFNKGTIEDFNSSVSELNGRAAEWQKENKQFEAQQK
jgi:hypothetical protein